MSSSLSAHRSRLSSAAPRESSSNAPRGRTNLFRSDCHRCICSSRPSADLQFLVRLFLRTRKSTSSSRSTHTSLCKILQCTDHRFVLLCGILLLRTAHKHRSAQRSVVEPWGHIATINEEGQIRIVTRTWMPVAAHESSWLRATKAKQMLRPRP